MRGVREVGDEDDPPSTPSCVNVYKLVLHRLTGIVYTVVVLLSLCLPARMPWSFTILCACLQDTRREVPQPSEKGYGIANADVVVQYSLEPTSLRLVRSCWPSFVVQLYAVDHSARVSMKSAANCVN